MPELPEVETIKRTLEPHLTGRMIERVEVRNPKFIVGASPVEFRRAVEGARIIGLARRGKFLILNLEGPDGSPGDIVVHLKMAGQLIHCRPEEDLGPTRTKHTHVVFRLDSGHELRYLDLRHFGRIYYPSGDPGDPELRRTVRTLASLGPEPRPDALDWNEFRARLASRRGRLKPLLLDQTFIAGLGNIYADECLFRAKLHPLRQASSLTLREGKDLFEAMEEVIGEAIELRGTSVRDYVDGEGQKGSFGGRLRAYGRTGEPCPRCGTPIERIFVGGRSSHFCPRCQKPPAAQGRRYSRAGSKGPGE